MEYPHTPAPGTKVPPRQGDLEPYGPRQALRPRSTTKAALSPLVLTAHAKITKSRALARRIQLDVEGLAFVRRVGLPVPGEENICREVVAKFAQGEISPVPGKFPGEDFCLFV